MSLASVGVIKYNNLNIKDIQDSIAWLALHTPSKQVGFLLEFHNCMEHILMNITQKDALKDMTGRQKLKLKSITEAIAINYFDTDIPRLLTNTCD